ncbi:MAG: DUF2066 domain-containing protein [Pseudomonadota bacterium]
MSVGIRPYQQRGERDHVLRWSAVVLLWAGLCAPSAVLALSKPDWLYTVALPVTEQTEQAREEAATRGLLEVLSRVTGLQSIPRGELVRAALARPDRFYNQFVFNQERDQQNRRRLVVEITYQSQAVLELVRAARLPVWDARRPQLLALLVVEAPQGERTLLYEGSTHPLATAVREVARARGLPLRLPSADGEAALDARDVWRYNTTVMRAAATRYAPDAILIGRAQSRDDAAGASRLLVDWRYALSTLWLGQRGLRAPQVITDMDADVAWVDEAQFQLPGQLATAQAAASAPIHTLANQLAERYAVLARDQQQHQIAITGVEDVQAYADLLAFLQALEFVDAARIEGLRGAAIEITLVSRAQSDQLLQLLTLGGELALPDSPLLGRIEFTWQG